MSSPTTEVKPSQVAQLTAENAKLKEENERLKEKGRKFKKWYDEYDILTRKYGGEWWCCLDNFIISLKAEIEELKKRDEDAMELSQKQNDLFMTQLEEKDQEIADLKEKYEPKPHKYKVGDVIRYTNNNMGNSYKYRRKFLEITGTTKCMYKVREIKAIIRRNPQALPNCPRHGSKYSYVISKDKEVWKFIPYRNIGKKDMELHGKLIDDCNDEGQNETEWFMNHYWYMTV